MRLTAAVPVAQFQLADHLPDLARALPEVRVIVHVTDRFVDLVQEGFDIAVRSHFSRLHHSALVQRQVSVEPVFLVAAPPISRAGRRCSDRRTSPATTGC